MATHLTPGQRALLKAELELRQAELDRQLATHQEGRSRADHARDLLERDYDDAPQRAMDREVDLTLSDQDLQEIGAVSRALQRIDDESFGHCDDCGREIPFDRLKVAPESRRCVDCESSRERAGARGAP